MKHPNTLAAVIAAGAAIAAQWLVQRYAHVALNDYWKTTVTSGATVVVLYVGKAGVKAAVLRVWDGPKRAWAGTAPRPKQ